MIHLDNVTLMALDHVNPYKMLDSMFWTMRHIQFANAVLLTDKNRFNGVSLNVTSIRVIHHEENDNKVMLPPPHSYNICPDHEISAILEPGNPDNDIKTSHIIYMEEDSAILNPWAWDPSWLQYDYIGAPWAKHCSWFGMTDCDGEKNNVGNSGFCLRSAKLNEAVRQAFIHFKDESNQKSGYIIQDVTICRLWRSWLETNFDIKFAPENVAARFSCEDQIYSGQFAFHGKETIKLNGWEGRYRWVR